MGLNSVIGEEQLAIAARDSALREVWGEFLQPFDWRVFATLTFGRPNSPDAAKRCFTRWVRRLEQRSGGSVQWFAATEASPGGVVHLHSLCGAKNPLAPSDYAAAWTFGRADVTAYDPAKGARFYIVKGMGTSRLIDYDVSAQLRSTPGRSGERSVPSKRATLRSAQLRRVT